MDQLRTAKKAVSKITKARAALSARLSRQASGGLDGGVLAEEPGNDHLPDVPEWILQQLPGLLRLLEACRLLVHVSFMFMFFVKPNSKQNRFYTITFLPELL